MRSDHSSLRSQEQFASALVLVAVFAAPVLVCLQRAVVADPDIWWHLRTGQWILEHRALPRTDPFSTFGMGKPWAAYSWLFELIVLKLYEHFQLVGTLAFSASMVLAITVAMHHLIKRLQLDFTKIALLTITAMVSMSRLYAPRPWLLTILFFVLEMDILIYARKTGKTRELLWLPLIFALWANIHVQFINGFVVLGIAVFEVVLAHWWPQLNNRLNATKLFLVSIACVLATFLNPYGWRIYKIAYELASQKGVLYKVQELQAMPFREAGDYGVLLLALAAVGALAWNRRVPVFETTLLTVATLLAFRSQRDLWMLVVAACAVLASELPGTEEQRRRLPRFALPIVGLAVVLVVFAGGVVLRVNNSRLHALLADTLPVRAVEVIKERHLGGPLYNNYDWGGFLIWDLGYPVSIDGRAALHGDEQIDRSVATWSAEPSWASNPELSSAGLVIAPVKAPLAQILRMDSRFQLAYEDKVAAVFVARGSEAQAGSRPASPVLSR